MTKKVDPTREARNALGALRAILDNLSPADRELALSYAEIVLDTVREAHDTWRALPADVAAARSLRRWARIAAYMAEHGEDYMQAYIRAALKKTSAIVDAPAKSVNVQRAVERDVAWYANRAGDVSTIAPMLAALLARRVEAPVSISDATALLNAVRRKPGQRARGEPTRDEALAKVLGRHAQSAKAVAQVRKRQRVK